MSVQGYSNLNGIVSNPYAQAQASTAIIGTTAQDNMAQNAILTGSAPLASAVAPANQMAVTSQAPVVPVQQTVATSQAAATSPANEGTPQLAQVPPAQEGCGAKLDCVA